MMKLYNIFAAIATKLFHYGQKSNDTKLVALCPQIAILGYTNTHDRCFIIQNLIQVILKFYVYKSEDL